METLRIVWQAPDGSIHITTPLEPRLVVDVRGQLPKWWKADILPMPLDLMQETLDRFSREGTAYTLTLETDKSYLDRTAGIAKRAAVLRDCVRLPDVQVTDIPSRRFRHAWRWANGKIVPDLNLAKQLLLAEIPLRSKASAAKLSRIRGACQNAKTVEELESSCAQEGWLTPIVQGQPFNSSVIGEDL